MRTVLTVVALSIFAPLATAQAPEVSSDCRAIRLIKRLARIDAYMPTGLLGTIVKQEQSSCSTSVAVETVLWSTGVKAKHADGTWHFPNGITAIFREGRLGYTRGTLAKVVQKDGAADWHYPNGVMAKATDGTWRLPNGSYGAQLPGLVALACSRVSAEVCRERRADIDSAQGDERDLAVIEFAWLTRETGNSASWIDSHSK
jgi:hypothetical protein